MYFCIQACIADVYTYILKEEKTGIWPFRKNTVTDFVEEYLNVSRLVGQWDELNKEESDA